MKNHFSRLRSLHYFLKHAKLFLFVACCFFSSKNFAQVGISSTTITPDASSILELRSTTAGFLPPRMTSTQRDAITSPATGLLIYNTTTNQLNYYNSGWQVITVGGTQLNGTGFVKASGTTISYDNSTYLTANQSITWTGGGDVSGSASGITSISPSLTITGLRGVALPTLSSGFLKYNGSSWVFDNSPYITNANVVFNNQSNTYSAGFKQIFSANGTSADIRLTGNTSDPSSLSAGDIWYNTTSNVFKGRFNTTTRQFATLDGTETFSNKDFTGSGNTFPTFNQNTTGTASNITGVLNASSHPALTGDVTTSSGSVVTTISNNVVTNSNLAQMSANTIKGNNTGSTANASDLTTTQVAAMLPAFTSSANGLVPASGGGTDNFLRADGTFAYPSAGVAAITSVSAAINTTETNLITYTIPANRMTAATSFRIQVYGTCTSTAANASNIRVRLGTAGTSTDAIVAVVTPTAATSGSNIPFTATLMVTIRTTGSGGTAGGGGSLQNNGITGITSVTNVVTAPTSGVAVNTTVSNIIHVSYQSAATTTTSTFQIATIEVVNN